MGHVWLSLLVHLDYPTMMVKVADNGDDSTMETNQEVFPGTQQSDVFVEHTGQLVNIPPVNILILSVQDARAF